MYKDFLNIVQAALWNQAMPEVKVSEDLIRLIMKQGVGPLVFPRMQMTPMMKMVCVQNMQQHVQLQFTLEKAWGALQRAGIDAVLMKGVGLAMLYDEPQQRAWGDIDLFVGKEHYHPACAVMRETFPGALKFDEELDHYKHYNIIADGVSIETHRVSVSFPHPTDERRYAKMEAYGMVNGERLSVNGLEVKVFEPTFNALFVFLHSWEHMMSKGASVRQLCDLALLLHRYKDAIDATLLRKWLKALHLYDVWQVYAYNLVNSLGLPLEEMLFYTESVAARAEKLMEDLLAGRMDEGLSGEKANGESMKGKAPRNRILRKIHTMRERMQNSRRMGQYSPAYARHMNASILINGAKRLFAKDRHWE